MMMMMMEDPCPHTTWLDRVVVVRVDDVVLWLVDRSVMFAASFDLLPFYFDNNNNNKNDDDIRTVLVCLVCPDRSPRLPPALRRRTPIGTERRSFASGRTTKCA